MANYTKMEDTNMKENKKILVEVGYFDFEFTDVNEAITFADIAHKTIKNEKQVKVTITYEEEEDEV